MLSKLIGFLDLPDINQFVSNPTNALVRTLSVPLGGFGLILVYFLFVGLVWDYTENLVNVAIFSLLFGITMSVLFTVAFQVLIYVIIVSIFANIIWRVFFMKKRE